MGKREITRYEQFLLFPQCFQKACIPGASKGVIVWEWVDASTNYFKTGQPEHSTQTDSIETVLDNLSKFQRTLTLRFNLLLDKLDFTVGSLYWGLTFSQATNFRLL